MLQPVTSEFIATLTETLGEDILRPADALYLEEPRKRIAGHAGAVVAPRNTQEVSDVLKLCSRYLVGVIPFGGGTGLVGGQIMAADQGPAPLILSLERMNTMRAIYPSENVLVAEAGMTLASIQEEAEKENRLFPLSLASEGSCRIGGNLATNAGGVNVLRYGNTRDLCLGVEAVLADGSVLNNLSRLRKDNTGYDVKNLLIGSEGTLGVITAASLRLSPRPARVGTAVLVVRDPAAALELLGIARDLSGDGVSAFELLSGTGVGFVRDTLPEIYQSFADVPEWSVLVEFGLPAALDPETLLEQLFVQGAEAGLVSDGVIAQSLAQRNQLWSLREHIPAANKKVGAIVSHDISLPLSALAEFIPHGMEKVAEIAPVRVNCFGHLGDGNLHYNVFPPVGETREAWAHVRDDIERLVHDLVHDYGGSFSAEHGIGRMKASELIRYADPTRYRVMKQMKAALDPLGILNPGAVLT
ncbi:FAD-binding oxidoreductase [Thalassobius sp. I31.1]|uniref:FAD-binding oxidoreductase n=1 Tax=Thalassobius sp. I31.1 TaxID=2109912 RepID=UPI000D1A62D7|nr:FAD-binding oxidoreductase [Thalassobius sp. I31.1]